MTNLDAFAEFLNSIETKGAATQAATDQPIIDDLRAQVADLTQKLEECNKDEPMQAPMLFGARAKETSTEDVDLLRAAFIHAQDDLGPLRVTRCFKGALPTKYVPITPSGVVEIVSYKSSTATNVASFAASMRPGTMVAYHHEPEGPGEYDTGAQFVNAFQAEAAKWAKVGVSLGMISGGYQWRARGRGRDGSFLPPAESVGWYAIDTYRDGSSEDAFGAIVPLTEVDEFQAWFAAVRDRGRDLWVTEYGRGTVGAGEVASTPRERAAVIPADAEYLTSLGFKGLVIWYSDFGPDGRSWRFTDQASLDAAKSIER